MRLRYLLLDVFTETPYRGNQLAVFLDPGSLTPHQMGSIARELNLAETTFAWPTDDPAHWLVRIFTPQTELPFAGHPTIGTAVAIAAGAPMGLRVVTLEEPIGAIDVSLHTDDGGAIHGATFATATPPERGPSAEPSAVSDALGLRVDRLDPRRLPEAWSCGVPFTIVWLADLGIVESLSLDLAAWRVVMASSWAPNLYVVSPAAAGTLRCRAFVPGAGLGEDAATGAAAAALAGFLAANVCPDTGSHRWSLSQGVEMGRASTLELGIDVVDRRAVGVTVGGPAVVVGSGELAKPPS